MNIQWTANQLKLHHAIKVYRSSAREGEDLGKLITEILSCVEQNKGMSWEQVQEVVDDALK